MSRAYAVSLHYVLEIIILTDKIKSHLKLRVVKTSFRSIQDLYLDLAFNFEQPPLLRAIINTKYNPSDKFSIRGLFKKFAD